MELDLVKEKISAIVCRYISENEIKENIPLTSRPHYFGHRSLVAVFIDIEQEFNIDLNKIFDQPMDYSINGIAKAVNKLI